MWYVSEVARLKEEHFARWIGGEPWHQRDALRRLFAEAEPVVSDAPARAQVPEAVEARPVATAAEPDDGATRVALRRERMQREERQSAGGTTIHSKRCW